MAAQISTLVAGDTGVAVQAARRIGTDPVLEARGVSRRFRSGGGSLQ